MVKMFLCKHLPSIIITEKILSYANHGRNELVFSLPGKWCFGLPTQVVALKVAFLSYIAT